MFAPQAKSQRIITSLLDVDFYKLTMLQFILAHYRNVQVRLGFKNRTKGIHLGRYIDEKELRQELDHVMQLRVDNTELHFLRGTNEYGERMFRESNLQFLKNLQLPAYELEFKGDDIRLEFPGEWADVTLWETISLAIMNELYYRRKMAELSNFGRELVYAEGAMRLGKKIETLKQNPNITFSEFGKRRRFSKSWQEYVVQTLCQEVSPQQFLGISNTSLAMKHGLLPMGTNAHELSMTLAAISGNTDEGLRHSQDEVLQQWWELYGEGLSIALPDTFGSDYVFRTMTKSQAQNWKGFRQDSGDPFVFGEKQIKFYQSHGVDARKKMVVFSDGLTIDKMLELERHFRGRLLVTFGWGTDLTNDLGFQPLSLVTKVIEANGRPTVKLSDTLEKAIGPRDEVGRYARAFGYSCDFSAPPVY